jgi:hypothetical protein
VACGRRFGKTETGKIAIIEEAFDKNHCWWMAPTYGTAAQVWRDLKAMLRGYEGIRIHNSDYRIDLPAGSISIRSAFNADRLRGAGLDFVVLDEAAYMPPDVWPEVVRPMLLDRRGRALFLSTPRGHNWFWDLFRLGMDGEENEWAAFQFPSSDNPYLDADELAQIERVTPARVFEEEYLAKFRADAGQVFRGVRDAATAPPDAAPIPGRRYVAGVDWGRDNDFTAIAIIDAESGQMVALDRFNGIGWAVQRGRLAELCRRWSPETIWAEANSIGAVNIEALQAEGLPVRPFQTTAQSKTPLIDGLALGIEQRELALLPDPTLLHELESYTLDRLPGGGYRYSAPSGGHDDTVIATALAWHGVRYGGARIDFI